MTMEIDRGRPLTIDLDRLRLDRIDLRAQDAGSELCVKVGDEASHTSK